MSYSERTRGGFLYEARILFLWRKVCLARKSVNRTPPWKERFEYKRFYGAIDAEKNEVVMKDVLVATDAGNQTAPLQDLENGR
jgi:hypothetical protein